MIYYFSGTGNSKYAASQIAKYTNDKALFIPQVMAERDTDITAGPDDVVGIVFPVYAWAPPAIVMDFLSHVHTDKKTFTYAVCTCGDEAGRAMNELKRVFDFKSAYSITMPNNYIPMFDLDETELMKEKINVAVQRLPRIASEILARKEAYEVHEGQEAVFKTSVIHPLFAALAMNPAKFSVDSTCVACGACVKNCPFGTIKLDNGKPVWSGRCQMCMSCIMKCPKHAIQCGNGTRRRGRYVYPDHTSDVPPAVSSAEKTEQAGGTAQFINGADVKLFSNPGVISRQLLTPANSQNARITLTEVHLRPGAEQGRHVHAHSEQTWYALRGTGSLLLADGAEKVFTAGDVVRFPENTVHGLKNTGDTEFVYVSVTCPPADFSGAYEDRS